jgi:hypothetical protein
MPKNNKVKHLPQALIFVCCSVITLFSLGSSATPLVNNAPLSGPQATTDQFRVHGIKAFGANEQNIIRQWLAAGVNATRQTLGIYPRPLELYVYPKKSNQPVPWAHTRRDSHESIHFYVDARYSLDKFTEDWTVYHEIAHLAIPFVGEDYAWFSEGFASYMQYQIMAQSGVLTLPLEQAYLNKIAPHLNLFQNEQSAASIATQLMKKRKFPAAYWGGAWFFMLADQQLKSKHNTSLSYIISRYQHAGRREDKTILMLLTSLDKLINDTLFMDLLTQFEHDPANSLYPTSLE